MKALHVTTFTLLVIGGLNWLVVGVAEMFYAQQFDLVMWLFGSWPTVANLIYILVGLSAVYQAWTHMRDCKVCSM